MDKPNTSLEARKVLVDLWRKMPPEVKFRRVLEAYKFGKSKMLAMTGLRDRHPDASEKSTFRFEVDQTYLIPLIKQLKEVLDKYPLRGKRKV